LMKRSIKIGLIVLFVSLLFLGLVYVINDILGNYDQSRADLYVEQIKKAIGTGNNEVPMNQIFTFDFDRAYVFKDNYIDGERFTQIYNLNLSIDQIESVDAEFIRRIVFVDKNGNLVYEFRYDYSDLNPKEEGMIIYPNTKIKCCSSRSVVEGSMGFEFLGVKETDFYDKTGK